MTSSNRSALIALVLPAAWIAAPLCYGAFINDPSLTLDTYLQNTLGSGNGYGDVVVGPGGHFGDDIYVTEFGFFTSGDGTGRVLRVTDSNNDGVGEATTVASAAGTGLTSPSGIAFGPGPGSSLGDHMYVLDYPSSTARRFVYRVTNDASQTVSQFSNASIFNPNSLRLAPDGERLLVNAAQTFTAFGGGADGLVYSVAPNGSVGNWANGSNDPNGFWDVNNHPATSPDGWYTFSNHSINPNNQRKIVQLKDLNGDGDANDPGEHRELLPLGAPVNQQSGFGFDALGRLYHSTGDDITRYTDLNGDGDYWDAALADFDAGEQEIFAEDFGAAPLAFAFNDAGDMFFTVNVGQPNGSALSTVYRISGAGIPEPTSLVMAACVGAWAVVRSRRAARG